MFEELKPILRLHQLVLMWGSKEDLVKIREITKSNTQESIREAVLYMEQKIAPK